MELTKEEQEYIKERELKRPLRAIHVWSLAVGVVIAGEYFGWNYGLPVVVAILALFAAVMYSVTNINVLPFTLVLYLGGMMYYGFWARKRLKTAAPEEVAARFAREYATANPSSRTSWLGTSHGEVVTALVLLLVVVSLGWIILRAMGVAPLLPDGWEIVYTTFLYALALGCVCGVALLTTQDRR